ncbi:tRNA (adenine-N1)-methyltransferase [Spirillospora sp. NPDC029432]|uniref:tRNA (adenine-N1)-methyltransferase n=1 Tax=Spirillospora sp. NPDC029432 TaxID=3154599 RepID=UPI0034516A16
MSEPTPTPGAPAQPTATGRIPHGPFRAGDQVQLTDPKGRINTITLQPGKAYHSHKGAITHDEIIGSPEGTVFRSTGGVEYLAFRPLLADFTVRMPRGAAVVYPKDAAQIVAMADIFPGARVVEAGAGSGALTCSLLRAVGEHGLVTSYERRPDFADIARANVEKFFGGPHPAWRITVGSLEDALTETDIDRVVLDMLAPWECVDTIAKALIPGGMVCAYIATTTQMSRIVEELRGHGAFAEPYAFETMLRSWHVEGLAVRPDHRMVGHTGFLVTARRLADGVTPPTRRRRPAKGAPLPAPGTTPAPPADTPATDGDTPAPADEA